MIYVDMTVYTLAECCNIFMDAQAVEPSEIIAFNDETSNVQLVELSYQDIRYGVLSSPKGVPFSTEACFGLSTISTQHHIRYDDNGKKVIQDISDTDKVMFIDLVQQNLKYYKNNSKSFYDYMAGYANAAVERVTPLPWNNQSINRRKYLTMELLTNGSSEPEQ